MSVPAETNDRLMIALKERADSIQLWLYDDVKSLMGMSNVLRRCKICLRAIRNASMTDQTVKAGTQEDTPYWLLYHACTCMLFLPPSEYAHALYSVAFPVDMVALALVVRCVCMHRIFFVDFFNSEHV